MDADIYIIVLKRFKIKFHFAPFLMMVKDWKTSHVWTHLLMKFLLEYWSKVGRHLTQSIAGGITDSRMLNTTNERQAEEYKSFFILSKLPQQYQLFKLEQRTLCYYLIYYFI